MCMCGAAATTLNKFTQQYELWPGLCVCVCKNARLLIHRYCCVACEFVNNNKNV